MDERRRHRRLAIRLPMECSPQDLGRGRSLRTVTLNVSTGGLYFEADLLNGAHLPERNSLLEVELIVPPGDGYFPYEGRVSSTAQVVRCESLPDVDHGVLGTIPRVAIAARFKEPLRLVF